MTTDPHNTLSSETVRIVGAGPAGLSAAIVLAGAGRRVVVHEAQAEVGRRFGRDFQGLENWSTVEDVLSILRKRGLNTDFTARPCHSGTVFDAWDDAYTVHSELPIFYLVERGSGPGSLDAALLRQARSEGVEVRFNSRVKQLRGEGILAAGPRVADAIAVGYQFDTDMEDGFWAICDDRLAPKGYAYLLIMAGRGTMKSCMFSDFKHERVFVERSLEAFRRLVGLEMKNPVFHGGAGNARIPAGAYNGRHPVAGEHAGFQDALWGFGIRTAILSGILAAQSLLTGEDYDALWRRELLPQMQTSVINRALYALVGNRGYRWFLRRLASDKDIRRTLRRRYQPSRIKNLLKPWADGRYRSRRQDTSCDHVDCHCVWCRECSAT